MKTLITGGVRSGKSFQAEAMLVSEPAVTYIAPGPEADPELDPEWAARVREHQRRRPAHWSTVQTHDLAGALAAAAGPVLVDCLGTWLTALLDELDGWQRTRDEVEAALDARIQAAADALAAYSGTVVVVTNEVGMGVVPEHYSGRMFRDFLGIVNRQMAAECDEVMLVVAGRTLPL